MLSCSVWLFAPLSTPSFTISEEDLTRDKPIRIETHVIVLSEVQEGKYRDLNESDKQKKQSHGLGPPWVDVTLQSQRGILDKSDDDDDLEKSRAMTTG